MTIAPLAMAGRPPPRRAGRLVARGAARRRPPSPSAQARRRRFLALAKVVLPLAAGALMATVALWPELSRKVAGVTAVPHLPGPQIETGQMIDASYHGLDEHGRPYALTARAARQSRADPDRIDLTDPKGDLSLETGSWVYGRARAGVYEQHEGKLDLSGDVTLYRDDGTTLITSSAAVDLRQGAAIGGEQVHAEGPFGSLDAQGFDLTDRGTLIRFTGPGRMILNAARAP